MRPVIALVGRPNVGKSTLFNRLTRTRDALVANYPGLTRDRQYGVLRYRGVSAIVIDTGGMGEECTGPGQVMHQQARIAIAEADVVVLLVDAQAGLTAGDEQIAAELRAAGRSIVLAVNKSDGASRHLACAEFHRLGLAPIYAIAANRGRGVEPLLSGLFAACGRDLETPPLPESDENQSDRRVSHVVPGDALGDALGDVLDGAAGGEEQGEGADAVAPEADSSIAVAVLGRPNVGKSTLINRLLGEERVVVYDEPGTTRDSIAIPFERDGRHYTLIDTAGVRRRARVHEMVEKFSVVKSLEAIERASVVLLVIDAQEGVTEQDAHLAGHTLEAGRAMVLVINKWDGLEVDQRRKVKRDLERRLVFLDFARQHFVSALHGSGVGLLLDSVVRAHQAATRSLTTSALNEALHRALAAHQPPHSRGRRIKPRYAHQGGHQPPRIIIHGNQVDRLPPAYTRYLERHFRNAFELHGTPVRIEYRASENPFADRPNPLTERQQRRRQRMIRHAKITKAKRRKRR
ncbi:ribosome biogenesis GTPase Der [Halorhodospira abdelmalekii]|uniref:ribosome biogenesis GTPase Der n=1 Tax=Halorhodospira abdelmalekii TaxID=421629 RepID=UPI001904A179|nr:ribosome biogenesis GTPase Der [Halorhodospira abdelmalekii]MBK1734547.1 ribosome biogenesis GTPase Der [Halorhodospira abdelmalekii]